MASKVVIAITCGDVRGIGPEVVVKALMREQVQRQVSPLLIGPAAVFEHWAQRLKWQVSWQRVLDVDALDAGEEAVWLLEPQIDRERGEASSDSGRIAAGALEAGVRFARTGRVSALVTAPLSKEALHRAGYEYPGMTEFIAERTGSRRFAMMMVSGDFRVALVTTHCALSDVGQQLSKALIVEKLTVVHRDLKRRFGIPQPRIAVCALNPHAGEGGLFGREELDMIAPAVGQARAAGIDASGPYSADALFARHGRKKYDAYLAMYHDQGLIPVKLLHSGRSVNYTAGLPIIRTSPDHGTAFDIAGKGIADESSMVEAIGLACRLAQNEAVLAH